MTSIVSSLEFVAHVAGRLAGATAMASPATRSATSLRKLCAVWECYLRDAGAGDVGREHKPKSVGLFTTVDPRRDGVLLWLADHAGPTLADSVAVAVRAIGAKQRLGSEALDILAIALELMPAVPDQVSASATFEWLWAYVERLRREPEFAETTGEMIEIVVSPGRLSTYRSATPGACWAANLALAARAPSTLLAVPPATLSRLLFKLDLNRDEQRQALTDDWLRALERSDSALWDIHRELCRGTDSLIHLSKNARGRDAWSMIVASGGLTRAQLTRSLCLSRGGAAVVVSKLFEAGLVCLSEFALLVLSEPNEAAAMPLDDGLSDAAARVDQAMAEIDRLLARPRAHE